MKRNGWRFLHAALRALVEMTKCRLCAIVKVTSSRLCTLLKVTCSRLCTLLKVTCSRLCTLLKVTGSRLRPLIAGGADGGEGAEEARRTAWDNGVDLAVAAPRDKILHRRDEILPADDHDGIDAGMAVKGRYGMLQDGFPAQKEHLLRQRAPDPGPASACQYCCNGSHQIAQMRN